MYMQDYMWFMGAIIKSSIEKISPVRSAVNSAFLTGIKIFYSVKVRFMVH